VNGFELLDVDPTTWYTVQEALGLEKRRSFMPDGSLKLDTIQETIEAIAPYKGEVVPPVSRLSHWAYSLVTEAEDKSIPYSLALIDAETGEVVVSDSTTDGIASIEAELSEQTYELRIDCEQALAFRAICTQTYGYRA
jgi:hypothetical protein